MVVELEGRKFSGGDRYEPGGGRRWNGENWGKREEDEHNWTPVGETIRARDSEGSALGQGFDE